MVVGASGPFLDQLLREVQSCQRLKFPQIKNQKTKWPRLKPVQNRSSRFHRLNPKIPTTRTSRCMPPTMKRATKKRTKTRTSSLVPKLSTRRRRLRPRRPSFRATRLTAPGSKQLRHITSTKQTKNWRHLVKNIVNLIILPFHRK